MRAVELRAPAPITSEPLQLVERDLPEPGPGEVRVRVHACALLPDRSARRGGRSRAPAPSGRTGAPGGRHDRCARATVAPISSSATGWVCRGCTTPTATCEFCLRGEENLCEHADFTGWTVDGGYADALTVPESFAVQLPDALSDLEAAPLLCAGVIGYRALTARRGSTGRPRRVDGVRRVGAPGDPGAASLGLRRGGADPRRTPSRARARDGSIVGR